MNRSSIDLVIESNNHGVHLMGQRQFLVARQAFYNASDTLKAILDEQENAYFQALQSGSPIEWQEYATKYLCFDEVSPAAGPAFIVRHDASASAAAASRYDVEAEIPGGGRQHHERRNANVDYRERPSHQQPVAPGRRHASSSNPPATSDTTTERRRKSSATTTAENSSAKIVNDSDDALFVFLQPILLSENIISRARNPPITHVSICILINLALSCHASALDDREVAPFRAAALIDAINLYQLAYSLQVHTRVEVARIYTFAMINNLGQLHMMLHEQQGRQEQFLLVKSRECFAILMRMIAADRAARSGMATTGDPPGHPAVLGWWSLIEDTYVDLFLDNVFLMGMGYDGPCHAAGA